jgi:predicted transglutaminase-like cysteine proteinase
MVLVSIFPFAPRRIFLLVSALIGLCATSAFADSMFLTVNSTPYDRQMSRIQPVLFTGSKANDADLTVGQVNHWMQDLRAIPYGFSMQWKTPGEVRTAASADCKGKAVALYQQMRESGARNVRLVIGKRSAGSRLTHTWVEWSANGGTYVLDPTINWSACRAEQLHGASYVPFYAYAGSRKYRALTAPTYAKL